MFEDSILDSGGKGKKAATVFISTVVHFALARRVAPYPVDLHGAAGGSQVSDGSDGTAASPASAAPPAAAAVQSRPVPVKPVQVDPGAIVAPTEIPETDRATSLMSRARVVSSEAWLAVLPEEPRGGVVRRSTWRNPDRSKQESRRCAAAAATAAATAAAAAPAAAAEDRW